MTIEIGTKVLFGRDQTKGEVIKINKNGTVRVSYWAQGGFMTEPKRWTDTFKVSDLTIA